MAAEDDRLDTSRLILRRFRDDDVGPLAEMNADPEVMRFITGGRATPRDTIKDKLLPALLASYRRSEGYGCWITQPRSAQNCSSARIMC